MELWQLDVSDLARKIRLGQVSSREAVTSCFARMDAVDGKLNAVVRRMDDEALAAGDACDSARARGESLGPLGHTIRAALRARRNPFRGGRVEASRRPGP